MVKDTSKIVEELGICPDFKTFYNENKDYMVKEGLSALLDELIKKEINTHIMKKPNLRAFEKVKQFSIIKEAFCVENGLMSATQKVKRNKVFEKYEELIGNMYNK